MQSQEILELGELREAADRRLAVELAMELDRVAKLLRANAGAMKARGGRAGAQLAPRLQEASPPFEDEIGCDDQDRIASRCRARRNRAAERRGGPFEDARGAPRVEVADHALVRSAAPLLQETDEVVERGAILAVDRRRPLFPLGELHLEVADLVRAAHEPTQERLETQDARGEDLFAERDRRPQPPQGHAEIVQPLRVLAQARARFVPPGGGELAAHRRERPVSGGRAARRPGRTELDRRWAVQTGRPKCVEDAVRKRGGRSARRDERAKELRKLDVGGGRVEDGRVHRLRLRAGERQLALLELDGGELHAAQSEREARRRRVHAEEELSGAAAEHEARAALRGRARVFRRTVEGNPDEVAPGAGALALRGSAAHRDERRSRTLDPAVERVEHVLVDRSRRLLGDLEAEHRRVRPDPTPDEGPVGDVMPAEFHACLPDEDTTHPPRLGSRPESGLRTLPPRARGVFTNGSSPAVSDFRIFEAAMKHTFALAVLGMHRSGTSALTGALGLLGVDLGRDFRAPHRGVNEKGYWAHLGILRVHERLLAELGSSWDDVRPLPPNWWRSPAVTPYRLEIEGIVLRDFASKRVWGVKDPRMCRLAPLWREAFAQIGCRSGYVLTHRHPLEVARSLARRDEFSLEKSALVWIENHLAAERATRGAPRVFTSFDGLLSDPHGTLASLESLLDFRFPVRPADAVDALHEFLTPRLRHHVVSGPVADPSLGALADLVEDVYETLEASRVGESAATRAAWEDLDRRYAESVAGYEEAITSHIADLQERIHELERSLDDVRASASWQVTRPLRKVGYLVSRVLS